MLQLMTSPRFFPRISFTPRRFCSKPISQVNEIFEKVHKAQKEYSKFNQEQVDQIFLQTSFKASQQRIPLAKLAHEETGIGVFEDKVLKNHFAAEHVYNSYKNRKTCGIISSSESSGIVKVAEPLGIICALIPITNPTSTTIYKTLMALKTRNGIVFCPHPKAKQCTSEAGRILLDAAKEAGAPDNIIAWIENPTPEVTMMAMKHEFTNLIWATGGPQMVDSAMHAAKPTITAGAGNCSVLIDELADVVNSVNLLLMSKTFDNGLICASEQSVVVVEEKYDEVKAEFAKRGAYILSSDETEKVRKIIFKNGHLNSDIVGKTAVAIAEMAGFTVPKKARALIGEIEKIGYDEPWSLEKLSPLLALYKVSDFQKGIQKVENLVSCGGLGHTSVYYTDDAAQERIALFSKTLSTTRILINSPSSQGAIGDIYNFGIEPTLSIGTGSYGQGSLITTVTLDTLLNIKVEQKRKKHLLWLKVPSKIYFEPFSTNQALTDLIGKERAFIVTDMELQKMGYIQPIVDRLKELEIQRRVFCLKLEPPFSELMIGVEHMQFFQPDVIIAFGGASSIDAAKVMRLLYEHPSVSIEHLKTRFMDLTRRIFNLPDNYTKTLMVAIPTTVGTGTEVSPIAVIHEEKKKIAICDYSLTPNIAIIDSQYTGSLSSSQIANGGFEALTNALESIVSVLASSFTRPLSFEAIRLLFTSLVPAHKFGIQRRQHLEDVYQASTLAGMSIANTSTGIVHSIVNQISGNFPTIPRGIACALTLPHVLKYNSSVAPYKMATFAQYTHPVSLEIYRTLVDVLGEVVGKSVEGKEEKLQRLIEKLETIRGELGMPGSLREAGVEESVFLMLLKTMSVGAFDDQCTGSNPRYPLVEEVSTLLKNIYYGHPTSFSAL